MSEIHKKERRRHLRFQPTTEDYADLDAKAREAVAFIDEREESAKENFSPGIVGLIIEQSHSGCSLVISKLKPESRLSVDQKIRIKVGPLPILAAQVRWQRELDDNVLRLGIQYLE